MWWRWNIGLLLAVEVLYMVLIAVSTSMPLDVAVVFFIVGALGTAPTAALYLVLLAAIPPSWSRRKQRIAAVAMSPLLGGFVLLLFPIGLVVLPPSLLYGALARPSDALRRPVRSRAHYATPTDVDAHRCSERPPVPQVAVLRATRERSDVAEHERSLRERPLVPRRPISLSAGPVISKRSTRSS